MLLNQLVDVKKSIMLQLNTVANQCLQYSTSRSTPRARWCTRDRTGADSPSMDISWRYGSISRESRIENWFYSTIIQRCWLLTSEKVLEKNGKTGMKQEGHYELHHFIPWGSRWLCEVFILGFIFVVSMYGIWAQCTRWFHISRETYLVVGAIWKVNQWSFSGNFVHARLRGWRALPFYSVSRG